MCSAIFLKRGEEGGNKFMMLEIIIEPRQRHKRIHRAT
jgi:hypothetical protein